MKSQIFWGKADEKEPRLIMRHKPQFLKFLSDNPGQEYEIYFFPERKQRTLAQNRLFFGLICEALAESSGNSKDFMHRYLEEKFLPEVHGLVSKTLLNGSTAKGEFKGYKKTCSMLTIGEMIEFIRECEIFAGEWDIKIPFKEME